MVVVPVSNRADAHFKTETERREMEANHPLNPGDVDDLIYGDLDYQVSQR